MSRIMVAGFLGVFLFGCGQTNPIDDASSEETISSQEEPELRQAPEFDLVSFSGGTLNSSELKGKVLIIDFWATWCKPCIDEIPNFNALNMEQPDDKVVMLGITVESGGFSDIEPYIKEFDIQYPVVIGDEAVVAGFGGLIGFPTTFVVTPDWKVYRRYLGMKPDKKERLEQDILALIGGPTQESDSLTFLRKIQ